MRKATHRETDRKSRRDEEDEEYADEESDDDDEEEEEEEEDGSSVGGSSADSHKVALVATNKDNKRNSMWARDAEKHTDVTNRSFEGILYRKTKLNHKKYWAVVMRQHLLLSHHGYDNKRKSKILKVNKDIDLHDYDVSITSQSGGKFELKLVCPGKKSHLFYCKDKSEGEGWQKEIKKASKLEFASENHIDLEYLNEETSTYVRGDIYEVISNNKKQHCNNNSGNNNNNNSGSSHNNSIKSLDNYGIIFHPSDVVTVSSDLASASPAKITTYQQQQQQHQQQHGKAKKSKIHSLFSKVLNIRSKVGGEEGDDDDADETLISGSLLVAAGGSDQWLQRHCVVKKTSFQAHRQNDSPDDMIMILFRDCHVSQIPCADWLVLLLRQGNKDVQIKFKNHSELTKWYQVLLERIGKVPPKAETVPVPEVLYDEIREVYHHDHIKLNKRPALPDCPAPITPDVNQVLMHINECSYMDAIECRGVMKAFGMKERGNVTSNNQTPYANSDEPVEKSLKDKNYNINNIYNNMTGNSTTTTTTASFNNEHTNTTAKMSPEATQNEVLCKQNETNMLVDSDKHADADVRTEKARDRQEDIEADTQTDKQKHTDTYKETDKKRFGDDILSKTNTHARNTTNEQIINKNNNKSSNKNNNNNDTPIHANNNKNTKGNNGDINNTRNNSSYDNKGDTGSACKYTSMLNSNNGKNNGNNSNNNNNSNNHNNNSNNHNKMPGTSALISKFSRGFTTTTTTLTTTTTTVATTTTIATKTATATNLKTTKATNSLPIPSTSHHPHKLSTSQTSLLRLPSNDNNSNNNTRFKPINNRYSDTSAIKGNSIMEKIKLFESKRNES